MDILDKIAKEEWDTIHSVIKRYYLIPGYRCVYNEAKQAFSFKTKNYDGPDDWNYDPFLRSHQTLKERSQSLLSLELKRLTAAKIITRSEATKLKSMTNGDEQMLNLAKVIINKHRNKRLRDERRKARL